MKKPFNHTDLSTVMCAHEKCAMVHGREGTVRRLIKKNVIARMGGNIRSVHCYPCAQYIKTGRTLRQQKVARGKMVEDNTKAVGA